MANKKIPVGFKGANNEWIAGMTEQTTIFDTYFSRLVLLALSIYKWNNLPETMNERFLEKTLNEDGRACFTDSEYGLLNLRVAPSGDINFYENPTRFNCYSIGINLLRDAKECVYLRNNYIERSTYPILIYFAKKLTEIERTIIMNVHAQRTPILVQCEQEQLLTMKNMYMQYDGFMPVIYANKNIELSNLSVLNTAAPYLADKLDEEKKNTWHEALTYLGIGNSMDFKRAQVQTSEIEVNSEHYGYMAEAGLITRQQAGEAANKMFGTNISVERRNINEILNGGMQYGEIYDTTPNAD